MRILETRGREDRLFVETRAYQRIEHEVFHHGAILITGDPGEGKTACAWHVILKSLMQGYELFVVDTADEWREKFHPNKKQIFFIDDCFGKSRGIPDKVEEWQRRYEHLRGGINSHMTLFVATVRRLIYRELEEAAKRLDIFGKKIDISSPEFELTPFERLQIFNCHMTNANEDYQFVGDSLMDTIASGRTPRFPLSCRLYAVENKFQQQGTQFFCNPVSQLRQELWHLSRNDKLGFAALILLLVADGKLRYEAFDEDCVTDKPPMSTIEWIKYLLCTNSNEKPWFLDIMLSMQESKKVPLDTTLRDVQVAIRRMIGIYVLTHDHHYSFVHESILETVGIILGKEDLSFVLKHCSAHFIQQHVRIEVFCNLDDEEDTILYISESQYRSLAKRLTDDVMKGHIDEVFQNPSVEDISFSCCWCYYLDYLDDRDLSRFCNSSDKRGYSTMYWAARSGNMNMLRYILNLRSPTADCIHGACHSGNTNVIEHLVKAGVDMDAKDSCGFTPLMIACHSGNCELVVALIENGADVNYELEDLGTVLHFACWNEDISLVKTLLDNGAEAYAVTTAGWPCLYFSGNGENFAILQQLLKKGKHVNLTTNTGWTPLHLAAGKDNLAVLDLLLESGADLNQTTTQGWTPLFCACRKKRHNAAKILLDRGADPHITDHFGVSCLHRICLDGGRLVAKVLLDKGVNINVKSKAGYTPLHCASETGQADLVNLLLKRGADTTITGLDGRRPIDVARKKGWDNIIRILEAKNG